jgi:hypothetical protein
LALALGVPPDAALAFVIENCSITRLDKLDHGATAHWRVATVNHRPWGPGPHQPDHPATRA